MLGRFLLGQAALDPLLTKVAGRSPSGADSVSPDHLLTPSKNCKAVSVGRKFLLARPPVNPEQKLQGSFRRAQIPSRPTPIL